MLIGVEGIKKAGRWWGEGEWGRVVGVAKGFGAVDGMGKCCSFPPPVVGVSSSECGETLGRLEEVEFLWKGVGSETVELCGSWNPRSKVVMRGMLGTYIVVLRLPPGMYEFHFHVNGENRVSSEYEVNGRSGIEENNIRVVAVGMGPESQEVAKAEREYRIRQRLLCVTQLRGYQGWEVSDDDSVSEDETSESESYASSKRRVRPHRHFSVTSSMTSSTTSIRQASNHQYILLRESNVHLYSSCLLSLTCVLSFFLYIRSFGGNATGRRRERAKYPTFESHLCLHLWTRVIFNLYPLRSFQSYRTTHYCRRKQSHRNDRFSMVFGKK